MALMFDPPELSPGHVAPRAESWEAAGATAVAAGTAVALAGCASTPTWKETRTASTAILEAAVGDNDAIGCSAAVAADGLIVWAEETGVAYIETEAPLESFTPMNWSGR